MSKLITSVILAAVCWAVAGFIISNNPSVPFTVVHATVVGGIAGLILG